jgi:hypothetical protein
VPFPNGRIEENRKSLETKTGAPISNRLGETDKALRKSRLETGAPFS